MADRQKKLEQALGHRFKDREVLRLALTHSSAAQRARGREISNERLEFLGDRVLGLVIAEMIYRRFPTEDEGELARRHTALVRREALARVAEEIALADHLILSRGEEESGGRDNPGLLSDTCEAILAALYLDGGMEAASRFIKEHWQPLMEEDVEPPKDPKTALQEWAQGRALPLPTYREVGRTGPAHAPVFTVEVLLGGRPPVIASGSSKRVAEQAAAEILLELVTAEPPTREL